VDPIAQLKCPVPAAFSFNDHLEALDGYSKAGGDGLPSLSRSSGSADAGSGESMEPLGEMGPIVPGRWCSACFIPS